MRRREIQACYSGQPAGAPQSTAIWTPTLRPPKQAESLVEREPRRSRTITSLSSGTSVHDCLCDERIVARKCSRLARAAGRSSARSRSHRSASRLQHRPGCQSSSPPQPRPYTRVNVVMLFGQSMVDEQGTRQTHVHCRGCCCRPTAEADLRLGTRPRHLVPGDARAGCAQHL